MLGNNQSSPLQHPSNVFRGIRFVLFGFDLNNKPKVLRKLIDGGGVDALQYGPNCTHVIVDKLAYDDPICIAARRDGKVLVSGLWVDHSFDVGMPVDATSVMYRPTKDLNGIPGARCLVICLTGYQRQDRDDIMTMVELMGANFSKPLIANKVTHLICYKFEGEKYELAKKIKRIKLVNHRWLEECLKAWEIVSEADYDKSGYELEMLEAEAKDSEEEAEGRDARHNEGKTAIPHDSVMLKQGLSGSLSNDNASKGFGNDKDNKVSVAVESTSNQTPRPHEVSSKHPAVLGSSDAANQRDVTLEPSNLFEGTVSGLMVESNSASTSKPAKRSPSSAAEKFTSISYSRKTPKRATPSTEEMASNLSSTKKLGKLNLSDAFNMSSSLVEQAKDESPTALVGFRTPAKDSALGPEEEQIGSFSGQRKAELACGSSKRQKMRNNENPSAERLRSVLLENPPAEMSNHLAIGNDAACAKDVVADFTEQNSPSNSKWKSSTAKEKSGTHSTPTSKTFTLDSVEGENSHGLQISLKGSNLTTSITKVDGGDVGIVRPECTIHGAQELQGAEISSPTKIRSDYEKSNTSPNLEKKERNSGSNSKPIRRMSVGKKLLGLKQNAVKKKTANQKGSIYLKNSELRDDAVTSSVEVQKAADDERFNEVPPAAKLATETEVEKNDFLQCDKMDGAKSVCMDDETEPPEDKEEAVGKEKHHEGEPEKIVDTLTEEKAGHNHEEVQNDGEDKFQVKESTGVENLVKDKATRGKKRPPSKKAKKTIKEVTDKKTTKTKELANDKNNGNVNDLENSMEVEKVEGDLHDANQNDEKKEAGTEHGNLSSHRDNVEVEKSDVDYLVSEKSTRGKKRILCKKTKKTSVLSVKEVTDKKAAKRNELSSGKNNGELEKEESAPSRASKTVMNEDLNDLENAMEVEKENMQIHVDGLSATNGSKLVGKSAMVVPKKTTLMASKVNLNLMTRNSMSKAEAKWFILTGHKLQRKEFQQIIRRLRGRVCRVSHQWSYQATHFIVPDPIRRTEKFFAAAASGTWILKTDYLSASNEAGKFLEEEPFEWHKNGPSEDGQIDLEAPRKWRLLKQKTGHGAFYGMRIFVYGECIAPPLDTVKRAVKAGDGTIVATSPPYSRFLNSGIDFAIVSPGMPDADMWVQEFLRHEIPCVTVDYLVDYVCKPGHPLERHVQYGTEKWAEKSYQNLKDRLEEEMVEPRTPEDCNSNDIPCKVCGLRDRGEEMLICGNESGSAGCGVGTHIDCCDPPFEDVPEEDWFCPKCSEASNNHQKSSKRKNPSKSRGK